MTSFGAEKDDKSGMIIIIIIQGSRAKIIYIKSNYLARHRQFHVSFATIELMSTGACKVRMQMRSR